MRIGDVAVGLPSQPANKKEIVSFLTKKFSAFYQKDLYFDGMVPPVGGSGGKLRQLQLTRFSTDAGWLLLGYSLPKREVATK